MCARLVVPLALATLIGCGDDGGKEFRFATPTPTVARTPCRPEPTSCASDALCRRHADCLDSDGVCVAFGEGQCFCRFTGQCRYREAFGGCDGSCGSISSCISAQDLNPGFGDPRACLCEPPSPTPDPLSTPGPDTCTDGNDAVSETDT
jgi:hypothetical protein